MISYRKKGMNLETQIFIAERSSHKFFSHSLAEEQGWRGYVLEPLLEKWGKLRASLIISFLWLLWHMPLFFIEVTTKSQKGFGIALWNWTLQLYFLSIIFTWVYKGTRKSILAAILHHLMPCYFV